MSIERKELIKTLIQMDDLEELRLIQHVIRDRMKSLGSRIKYELKKGDEYKYVQIDPFFRKNNFAIIVKGNHVNNFKNNYKRINLKANFFVL